MAIKAINEYISITTSQSRGFSKERLFPVVDDLLDAGQADFPEAKGLRLVGHQWSPRCMRQTLPCASIPYRWLDIARNQDARVLLDAAGVGTDELPVLFFEDGSVSRSPDPRQEPKVEAARARRLSICTTW